MRKITLVLIFLITLTTNIEISAQNDDDVKLSYLDSNGYLYMMNANGAEISQIIDFPVGSYDWSPDGRQLVFETIGAEVDILILELETMEQIAITESEVGTSIANINPSWSPDGTRIAFTSNRDGNWEIYVVVLETMQEYRLTHNDLPDGFNGLTWTPDSKGVVFVIDEGIHFDEETQTYEEQHIYLLELAEFEETKTTVKLSQSINVCPTGEQYYNPRWSVANNQLAFSLSCGGDDMDIYVMDMSQDNAIENPSLINLTNNRLEYQAGYRGLAWNNIGTQLAFIAFIDDDTRSSEIFVLDATYDEELEVYPMTQLTTSRTNTHYRNIAWRPTSHPQN